MTLTTMDKINAGKLIAEYGGSMKKLGIGRNYLDMLLEGMMVHVSDNLLLKFKHEYNIPNSELINVDNAEYKEQAVLRAFEAISKSSIVEKEIGRFEKVIQFEDMLDILEKYYGKTKGNGRLSTIMTNIANLMPQVYSAYYNTDSSEFSLYDPVTGENMFTKDFASINSGKISIIDLPRNIESITINKNQWQERYLNGKMRKTGSEQNEVLITFKKDIPKKTIEKINSLVKNYGHRLGLEFGSKGDWLIEQVWSSGKEESYTGKRGALRLDASNKLTVYFYPFHYGKRELVSDRSIFFPLPMQLEVLDKIQNNWLYNRG